MISALATLAGVVLATSTYSGEVSTTGAYKSCVISTALRVDDGKRKPVESVIVAESACLREDLAMESGYRDRIIDNLDDRALLDWAQRWQVAAINGPKAARAFKEIIRKLAVAHIQYSRTTHAEN